MKYAISITISGIDPATGKCFCRERKVGDASTLQEAHKVFNRFLGEHSHQPSEKYGIFLSIRQGSRVIHRMQIN